MKPGDIVSLLIGWLRTLAGAVLLTAVVIAVLKLLGAPIGVRVDHIALAYLAGAYWLSK